MNFKGLELKVDEGNRIEIDPECSFNTSRIRIQGVDNEIILEKVLVYSNLFING